MPLQFQVVPLNFDSGIDTKSDSKMTIPGKLSILENGVFTAGKAISKRNGYDALGTGIVGYGSNQGPSDAAAVFNPSPGIEELIQIGNNKLYSYSQNQDQWIQKDDCYSLDLKYKSIYRNQDDSLNGDTAINGNVEIYGWRNQTTGQAAAVTVDSSTGAQISMYEALGASFGRTRVSAVGTNLFVFYVNTLYNLVFRTASISTPHLMSGETIVGAANTTDYAYDVVSANGFLWICLYNSAGTISMIKLSSNGSIAASTTFAASVINCMTIAVGTNAFVYWYESAVGLRYAVFGPTLSSVLPPTTIAPQRSPQVSYVSAIETGGSVQRVFYTVEPDTGSPLDADYYQKRTTWTTVVNSSAVTTAAYLVIRSAQLATKPVIYNGSVFVWINHQSNLQSTLFLMRSDGLVVGKSFAGKARGAGFYSLPSITARDASNFFFAQAEITKYDGNLANTVKSGISAISINFASPFAYQKRMLGKNLHIAGGYLSAYDGKSVTECGFHLFPEDIGSSIATTGGHLGTGAYSFTALYEWIDNMGQVHRSATAVPIQIGISDPANTTQVTLKIPTLRITRKQGFAGRCIIQIFRTVANGTVFYNVKSATDPVLYNDPTVDYITYADTSQDSVIANNAALYTTGNVLDNDAPESCTLMDVYQNRMVISGMEDPLEFGYSKTAVKGEGVAFSNVFKTRIDPLGGDISAIRLMDDKVILFKKDTIFYVSGDGPADTGASNNYTTPALITSDSGCPYPKSTVLTPLGLMYKSAKGIYLLSRGLDVQYVGAEVEGFNAQNITGASLLQDKNQVRFLTDSGVTLVYDYYFKQWSTFTNHTGSDAVNWKRTYCYLRTDGTIYKASASYADAGVSQFLRPVTGWIKLVGSQTFQRVRRVGFLCAYRSAHKLRVRVYYDYDEVNFDEYTFNADTVVASSAVPYQFRIHLKRQKCEVIKFEIQDISTGTAAESYSISDLTLEVGVKPGVGRMATAKSI